MPSTPSTRVVLGDTRIAYDWLLLQVLPINEAPRCQTHVCCYFFAHDIEDLCCIFYQTGNGRKGD